MVHPGDTNLTEQRLRELRMKIQDESYVAQAIESIAEVMARELLPQHDENQLNLHGGDSPHVFS
ncbi:hypothetical protein [Spirochaeta africana]|nr:hypothetical protein [Spirochaeta africana]